MTVLMCFTYFQTEHHQAEVPLSRNLKIGITPYVRLQQLGHLNPLNYTEGNKDYTLITTIPQQSKLSFFLHIQCSMCNVFFHPV